MDRIIEEIYNSDIASQPDMILSALKRVRSVKNIERLINEFQFDVCYKDNSLIIHFAQTLNMGAVELLINYGADARAGNDIVFDYACEFGPLEMVKRLLELGVPADIHGTYALSQSILGGNIQIVKLLIESGIDVCANNGEAIKTAVRQSNLEITKLLLDYGADIEVLNEIDEDDQRNDKHVEMAQMLLSLGVPSITVVKYAINWRENLDSDDAQDFFNYEEQ